MTAPKNATQWFNAALALVVAVFGLIAWGAKGNYASSSEMTQVELDSKEHDLKLQAHEQRLDAQESTLKTMAAQMNDIHMLLIEGRAPGKAGHK